MKPSAALFRLRRVPPLLWHLLAGLGIAAAQRLRRGPDWHTSGRGRDLLQWWHRRCARILGLQVSINGRPGSGGTLLVGNHVSWLDIVALASLAPARFMAKSEVRAWPLVGPLATLCGTLFVRRNSMSVLAHTIDNLGTLLQAGQTVTLFPEGTTTNGESVQKFHSGLLQAAIDAQRPVQPVALSYLRDGELDPIAPFIGDQSFVSHLWQMLGAAETRLYVDFCDPLTTAGADRRELAVQARRCIVARTSLRQMAAIAQRPEPAAAADAA